MKTVDEVFSYLCTLAPLELQEDFDNSGFLLGRSTAEVKHVLLALDITDQVVEEAVAEKVQLIVSHHPLIWGGLKAVTDKSGCEKLLRLAENGIAAICMHTNLDIAQGGVNDVLLALLGAKGTQALDNSGCGRIGMLEQPVPFSEFLSLCKTRLDTHGLRYHDAGRPVYRLAVMGGSGGSALAEAVQKGCDTYVTADIKYNQFLDAKAWGINLIDGDHFCTENPVMPVLAEKLRLKFPDVEFLLAEKSVQTVHFA